jgi:nucleotide-binding universal stress UspA family protein
METELKAAEAEFRRTLQGRVATLEWRGEMTPGLLVDHLCDEGRSADLVITQAAAGDPFDPARAVNTGNLLLQLGRPALVVPAEPHTRRLHRVLVGWKDAREPRRAVADALPLLRLATHVTVAAVAKADGLDAAQRQADDVVRWLSRHGIEATATAVAGSGQDDAADLHAIAESVQADVIVAGAYGHSRLREWLVGGVTRELLQQRTRCALLSH